MLKFKILILITNTCYVIGWINYYIITKHNGMAPIKVTVYHKEELYKQLTVFHHASQEDSSHWHDMNKCKIYTFWY